MKLTPETIQLIIAVVVLLLFIVIPFVTRLLLKTKWGREHNAELSELQSALDSAQALLINHQVALATVVTAVARANAAELSPIAITPKEAVKTVMRELVPKLPPAAQAVVKNTVSHVNATFAGDAAAQRPGIDDDPYAHS